MKQWLQQLLYKLRNYDQLLEQHQLLQQEKRELETQLQECKKKLTKQLNSYNEIEKPKFSLKELEIALKEGNKFTMKLISDYLKLDSYELVKNMAKIMN